MKNLPCNKNIINTMLTNKIIDADTYSRLKKGEKTPLLTEQSFNTYKKTSLESLLLKRVPPHLRNTYSEAVNILWSLDQGDYPEIITNRPKNLDPDEELEMLESTFIEDALFTGAEATRLSLIDINKSITKYLSGSVNKKVLKELNTRRTKIESTYELLNEDIRMVELYDGDLSVVILSSGLSSLNWERVEAGACNCCNDNKSIIERDYNTSHNELSVINNFLNHPASFYLFSDVNGAERGYARGHIECNNNKLFINIEAFHAKPCIHSKRTNEVTELSELSLIAGLIQLAKLLKIDELRGKGLDVARDYISINRKTVNGHRYSCITIPLE